MSNLDFLFDEEFLIITLSSFFKSPSIISSISQSSIYSKKSIFLFITLNVGLSLARKLIFLNFLFWLIITFGAGIIFPADREVPKK